MPQRNMVQIYFLAIRLKSHFQSGRDEERGWTEGFDGLVRNGMWVRGRCGLEGFGGCGEWRGGWEGY